MAKRLIATPFTYTMMTAVGARIEQQGSYLGRKAATRATLVAFLRRNGAEWKPRLVSIGSAYESRWIAR